MPCISAPCRAHSFLCRLHLTRLPAFPRLLACTRLSDSTKRPRHGRAQGLKGPALCTSLRWLALHACALQGAQLAPSITASAPPAPAASLSLSCRRAERHAAAGRAVPARQLAAVAGSAALSPKAWRTWPCALMHSAPCHLIYKENSRHT